MKKKVGCMIIFEKEYFCILLHSQQQIRGALTIDWKWPKQYCTPAAMQKKSLGFKETTVEMAQN